MDGCVKPGRTGFPATIQGVFRSKLGRHCCIGRRAIRFWTFIPRRDSEHRAALRGASHGEHSCPAGSQWLQWEPKVVKTYGGSAVLVLDLEAAMPEREFIQSPTPACLVIVTRRSTGRLDSDPVIYSSGEALGATQIFFGRLHTSCPSRKLNLVQFVASRAAKPCAGAAIVPHAAQRRRSWGARFNPLLWRIP